VIIASDLVVEMIFFPVESVLFASGDMAVIEFGISLLLSLDGAVFRF
jgi:hypothetical protein